MNPTLDLACALIACPSETPSDAHCQQLIGARLEAIGFQLETLVSGPTGCEVTNLWAKRPASSTLQATTNSKLLVFAGHTDVVPSGPVKLWGSDPFKPTRRDGKLFGRGAADMKTSLAAFVVATEEFVASRPESPLAIGFLLTSDEEGPAVDGTIKVCEMLQARGEVLDYCIVGEPTAVMRTGDVIKNGRRGSLGGKLTVKGTQGHIAYPHLANNPIHLLAPALAELISIAWDQGNTSFPPTSWQVSNIHGGTGAGNVIPGEVVVDFNFRFSTESTPESLQNRLQAVLDRHDLAYDLAWTLSGLPFLTPPGTLVDAVVAAIHSETGLTPELSTSGGTSDGRFIAKICPQVIECGPPNASIHKINEHIALTDVAPLKNIYRRTLENLHAQLLA
ncbi:MAG: succinyl-diaminopimelate desuccinylase [Comamonadaceae bacterium CG_4_10_14_3_um_filter_60_42]|nr:MAG: succinyl-diaminopimelate desuccinylase [Comamonadaceae bacterium CG2_30_59_20]PIY29986.1 MAG: succinyl-diaminopimelate desuccinylase [Comamonadaceae bacterium CG_4_10_14_3_um_filter_60_42]